MRFIDSHCHLHHRKFNKDRNQLLEQIGESDVFVRTRGGYNINPSLLECDYYDYLNNVPYAVRAYQGEYMQQYSWAEERIGSFSK